MADDDDETTGGASNMQQLLGNRSATGGAFNMQQLLRFLRGEQDATPPPDPLFASFDLEGVCAKIKDGTIKQIVVAAGAGISVSAGIPDFRTPGTGLYDNLQKYDLPDPQSIFEINYFQKNPGAFYQLAREMWPGTFTPTPTHFLIRLLVDKGLCTRVLTQNIDSLEAQAGIDKEKIVAAHGNFDGATCIATGKKVDVEEVKAAIMKGEEGWQALRDEHGGLVKPDITFFGENLPKRFFQAMSSDVPKADLLLVFGTSLAVQPFASVVDRVSDECGRVLINREKVKEKGSALARFGGGDGFDFDGPERYRDVFVGGDCDSAAWRFAELMGWKDELQQLVDGASQAGGGGAASELAGGDEASTWWDSRSVKKAEG